MSHFCPGCCRICPGLDGEGYCLDADRAAMERHRRHWFGHPDPVPTGALTPPPRTSTAPPRPPGSAAPPSIPDRSAPPPPGAQLRSFLHRHMPDYGAWRVLLDGEPVERVWYASTAGFVQQDLGELRCRVLRGTVEILPAPDPAAPPAPEARLDPQGQALLW